MLRRRAATARWATVSTWARPAVRPPPPTPATRVRPPTRCGHWGSPTGSTARWCPKRAGTTGHSPTAPSQPRCRGCRPGSAPRGFRGFRCPPRHRRLPRTAAPSWCRRSTPVPPPDSAPVVPVARLRRAIFARHCHPRSAWTRWASTPLILVPVWTRRPRDAAVVALWLTANPFAFGRPAHERAWATRAMLGEELWISRRPRDAAVVVSAVTSGAALTAIIAARRHRLRPALTAVAVQMALTLVYWEQMVRYID